MAMRCLVWFGGVMLGVGALASGVAHAQVPCAFDPPSPLVDTDLSIVRQYELARPAATALAERVWLRSGERALISQSGCSPLTITYALPLAGDAPKQSLALLAATRLDALVQVVPTTTPALAAALRALATTAPRAVEVELVAGREHLNVSIKQASDTELIVVHTIDR